MKDLFFASPTMLAARHASMPRWSIDFLLLSTDETDRHVLLMPIGQDDPLNKVADLASLFDRFHCYVRVRASSHPASHHVPSLVHLLST